MVEGRSKLEKVYGRYVDFCIFVFNHFCIFSCCIFLYFCMWSKVVEGRSKLESKEQSVRPPFALGTALPGFQPFVVFTTFAKFNNCHVKYIQNLPHLKVPFIYFLE